MGNTMNAKDAISASLAECFVTIDGNRYNFMQAINLEARFEKKKTEIPILGKTGKGNREHGTEKREDCRTNEYGRNSWIRFDGVGSTLPAIG